MKMNEDVFGKMLDECLEKIDTNLRGSGSVSFTGWYDDPAGFELILAGDWKHMHKRADNIIKEYFATKNLFVKIYEYEIGKSNCDWYEAEHKYMIRKTEPKKTKAELAELEELKKFAANILGG